MKKMRSLKRNHVALKMFSTGKAVKKHVTSNRKLKRELGKLMNT